jgi:uncharacterized repeat protein (TIGR03847 family)
MSFLYEFDDADAFRAGAIGEPGQRTFFIQIKAEERTLNVKCEKQQVAAISQHLRNLLKDLPESRSMLPDASLHQSNVEADFVLGTIGLGFDRSGMRMFIQLDELVIGDSDDSETEMTAMDEDDAIDEDDALAGRVRLFISPEQAEAFCNAADTSVAGGREPCRWCGAPKDPRGHACPRMN